jgi:hypothetical protein
MRLAMSLMMASFPYIEELQTLNNNNNNNKLKKYYIIIIDIKIKFLNNNNKQYIFI